MDKMIPVTNNTKNAIPVGSSYVMPGETKHFPAHQVPVHLRPRAEPEPQKEQANPLLAVLDLTIPKIKEKLPEYSDEQLQELKAAEEAGKARSTLLEVFAEIELERASARTDDDPGGESTTGDDDTGDQTQEQTS